MGRLDHGVGGRGIRRRDLVDLCVLRARIHKRQRKRIGGDGRSHDGRVIQAACRKRGCSQKGARGERGDRQVARVKRGGVDRAQRQRIRPRQRTIGARG